MNTKRAQTRILVVDDEDHIRKILVRTLLAEGYDVCDVPSGFDAIAKAAESAFDVLISDIRMPGIDGLELVRTIKADDPDIVAVMTSGVAEEEITQTEAMAAGASAYFTKPYTLDELLVTIEEILLDLDTP